MPTKIGEINTCATSGCGWLCCQFQQGNYIVLHPNELEAAKAKGLSVDHLEITDRDYNGGQKAVCKAKNTGNCDGGLKPLDCISYPFFPVVEAEGIEVSGFIKGKKCPLQEQHLARHAQTIKGMWAAVIKQNPEVAEWLKKVELVGYTEPKDKPDLRRPKVA